MADASRDRLEDWVRDTAAQLGLTLQSQHLPGVVQNYRRLAAQGALLLAHPMEESDEPAPVYRP